MPIATVESGNVPAGEFCCDFVKLHSLRFQLLDSRDHLGSERSSLSGVGCLAFNLSIGKVRTVAQHYALSLFRSQGGFGALADHLALFLAQGCVEVQNERVNIGSQFSNDERYTASHQSRDERYITAEPVELGNDDGAVEADRKLTHL